MKVYRVGGSVRDELLGLPVVDRDFVVVGATPASMTALGYQPVGRDFPVFLHPETHEEYALARTERKSGRGHQGFVFHADPDVTLEEDLRRRDLTINAMARNAEGGAEDAELIDPYGGRRDLDARVLRHVSPAFAEDPLRVLRVARFAARFAFAVADETEALMRDIVTRGELDDLSPERVWREFSLGLLAASPSKMLAVLRRCGALGAVAPELDALHSQAATGVQPDLGVATSVALDRGAHRQVPKALALPVQFGVAARHLGVAAAQALSARLKVGNDCRDSAVNAARYVSVVERAASLTAAEWLTMLGGLDVQRRPERLDVLIAVVSAYSGDDASGAIAKITRDAVRALSGVDYRAVATDGRNGVAAREKELRMNALENWLAMRSKAH